MKYSVLEKTLIKNIEDNIRDVTPGVLVRAYQNGRLVCDIGVGSTYAYYDLASLTKIVFAVQAMMHAFEEGKWNIDSKVSQFLEWFPHTEIKIIELLNHSSGLVWWRPFYKDLNLSDTWQNRREDLRKMIAALPLSANEVSVYSDVGFLVLGFILEKFYDLDLVGLWNKIKDQYYPGTTLEFHPRNQTTLRASLFAPTEECPWRRKLLQGEVHDENTWALGGVSTHSGLFGSIDDLGWYSLHLRSQVMGIARYFIKQKTTQLFVKRSRPEGKGDWALGFMLPTPGTASCGGYFSLNSIGHTGFTGTSIWYDPKADLSVVILSNRLVYGRELNRFAELRPKIHNWIVEGLRKSSLG
ncbi:MAG: serine hydrolase [Bdellovibrionaceae bacterium]|nr:serine hydrolase [Pseudobdellovibrionaceae bacterium]